MFLALCIMLSLQFEPLLPPNQELLPEFDGNHEELLEFIEGNQDEPLPEPIDGNQFEDDEQLDDDENIADPSTTPTPSPTPKTARTVEMG